MKKIQIKYTNKTVTINIGHNYIADYLQNLPKTSQYLVITDRNVDTLYHDLLELIPNLRGKLVVESGEDSKSFCTYQSTITKMLSLNVLKSDVILAIGGGVVTDLAGFIAGTYKRGISFVNIPTTLIGMVDASVGGKCGINVNDYKNQLGMFYHPKEVIIDDIWLETLPEKEFQNGMSEVIKIACTSDETFFSQLALHKCSTMEMIEKALSLKASIVERDEYDQSNRQILNFGHTIGHIIEKESHYQISHGQAVAYGMLVEAASPDVKDTLQKVLTSYGIATTSLPKITSMSDLWTDKKITNDEITMVVVDKIGTAYLKKVKIKEVIHE